MNGARRSERVRRSGRWWRTPVFAFVAALATAGISSCATNPATGKPQLVLVSRQQEIDMGRQAAQQVRQTIGLVADSGLQSYVDRIGQRVAAVSNRPDLPWSFGVVEDPTPNAFALPGGFIFVTRGLMSLMSSEAQLATVLGHEVGHVAARHQVEQISRSELAGAGLGIGAILFPRTAQQLGGLAQAGMQLLFLKYSRDDERQADALGYRYARAAHYDVRQMPAVFVALQRETQREGQSPLPTYLATHPGLGERITTTRARLASDTLPPDLQDGRDGYLHEIDGLAFGEDPRQGFFRDSVFYHPDLGFRIVFPVGWKTQNTAEAVLAQSPGQDALLELTLASGTDAASAARDFFAQQGVSASPTSSRAINGLSAVVGDFEAQTQQGAVRGTAAFIDLGGRVFRVVGFATPAAFDARAAAFGRTVQSFAAETDPAILGVRPDRIRIVRLQRSMTLSEFNVRYPSDISLEQLAIINQVEGGNSRLQAGTLVKRVARAP